MDRRAKGQRRRTVRGGRALARQVLDDRRHTLAPPPPPRPARPKTEDRPLGLPPEAARPGPRVSSAGGGVGTESALAAGGGGRRRKPPEGQTGRARAYSMMVRPCVAFSMTPRAVRCPRRVCGGARRSRPCATRGSAACARKRGASRAAVDASRRRHGPRPCGRRRGLDASAVRCPRLASRGHHPQAQ
jgi:hypothetical protein